MFPGLQIACASLSTICRVSLTHVGTWVNACLYTDAFTSFLADFIIARHSFLARFCLLKGGDVLGKETAIPEMDEENVMHVYIFLFFR